ncbi:MAG: SDR family oxidoreductase [SAR324 cluster bacterium]|nr:SDR family oxidoreductase [SAR324 cluster bacterium]
MPTALITGGCRGIGAGITRRFLAEGWAVWATYVSDEAACTAFRESLGEAAGGLTVHQCDIRREAEIVSLFQALQEAQAYPDALINNAGITGPQTRLADASADVIADVLAVNTTGTILMCREAVRRMSTARGGSGGAIINISTTGTKLGNPNQWVHYAASKGALDVFTNGLAREVAEEGIRVNAVSPGLTIRDAAEEDQVLARLESMRHEIPMARPGTVGEIAATVFWLCSQEASYITGAVIPVAGGR